MPAKVSCKGHIKGNKGKLKFPCDDIATQFEYKPLEKTIYWEYVNGTVIKWTKSEALLQKTKFESSFGQHVFLDVRDQTNKNKKKKRLQGIGRRLKI